MTDRAAVGGGRAVAAAVALYATLGVVWLAGNSWDPAAFAWFDRQAQPVTIHAHREIGREVVKPNVYGHDGRWFWALARDPFLRDGTTEAVLDRPAYRARRVLYPLAARPWLAIGEEALLWALPAINLAAVAGGTWAAVTMARRVGRSDLFAAAFALNPAVLFGFLLDTGDVFALALVTAAMAAWLSPRRDRRLLALAGFALAGLAREMYLLVPAALAVHALLGRRPRTALGLATTALPAAAWALYVRVRVGGGSQVDELGAPLAGFESAWDVTWVPLDYWGHFAVAVALLVFSAWVVVRALRQRANALVLASVPFAVAFPFLAGEVVHVAQNSTRALAPAITFMALAGVRSDGPRNGHLAEPAVRKPRFRRSS